MGGGASPAAPLWVASTDADSVVLPALAHQPVARARGPSAGRDLVIGTVGAAPGDLPAESLSAWHQRHTTADGHDHVHGANLGFTL